MVVQSKWLDRRFEYNPPVGEFPCLVARLRGTPARLEEIIHSLPERVLTVRSGNGWSIQEHVGHLGNAEELHDGRINDFLAGDEVLRAADMSNRRTYEADHNAEDIVVLLDRFRFRRHAIVKRLEELDEAVVSRPALHPRLNKPMRIVDMAFFFAEHDDHHLAIMIEMARRLVGA